MRISDWSSDVCSSDLAALPDGPAQQRSTAHLQDRGGQVREQARPRPGEWIGTPGAGEEGEGCEQDHTLAVGLERPRRAAVPAVLAARQHQVVDQRTVATNSKGGKRKHQERTYRKGGKPHIAHQKAVVAEAGDRTSVGTGKGCQSG